MKGILLEKSLHYFLLWRLNILLIIYFRKIFLKNGKKYPL